MKKTMKTKRLAVWDFKKFDLNACYLKENQFGAVWRLLRKNIIRLQIFHTRTNFMTTGPNSQIREQMSGPDLHVFTLRFVALKKWSF